MSDGTDLSDRVVEMAGRLGARSADRRRSTGPAVPKGPTGKTRNGAGSACRYCGEPVRWATSEASGKAMPIDPFPSADGNVILTNRDNRLYARVVTKADLDKPTLFGDEEMARYKAHFATCQKLDERQRR